MELFRITQELYASDLSGNGSYIYGGRWNSEGNYALYTSFSRSLALLETLAHVPAKLLHNKPYLLITLRVPDKELVKKINVKDLPSGWDAIDAPLFTQRIGDRFLHDNNQLLMEVPSVLMPEESNFILNPLFKGMKKVSIIHKRRIVFDNRIELGNGG